MSSWVFMSFMPYMFPMAARFLYLYPKEAVTNHYALAAFFVINGMYLLTLELFSPILGCCDTFASGFCGSRIWIHVAYRIYSFSALYLHIYH